MLHPPAEDQGTKDLGSLRTDAADVVTVPDRPSVGPLLYHPAAVPLTRLGDASIAARRFANALARLDDDDRGAILREFGCGLYLHPSRCVGCDHGR